MTVAEAKAFIRKAETVGIAEVDIGLLLDALTVLTSLPIQDAEFAARATDLVKEARGRGLVSEEQEAAQREESLSLQRDFLRSEKVEDEDLEATAFVQSALMARLNEAASAVGVGPDELETLIAAATSFVDQVASSEFPPPPGTPTTVEQYLEAQIEAWEAQAIAARGAPIGVPQGQPDPEHPGRRVGGFVAQRVEREPTDFVERKFGVGPHIVTAVEPRYFDGDQYTPAGLDPGVIARLQLRLVNTGFLEEGEYWAGFWDGQTADAYAAVLGHANQSGATIDETIERLIATLPDSIKEARARADQAKTFQAPPFIGPDLATIAQRVKSKLRSELGREPSDVDMAELTKFMSSIYVEDFDAQVAAQRSAFDASQESLETGEPVTPRSVTDVDPVARFNEFFEQRFRPEIDRLGALGGIQINRSNVFASLRTMGNLIGGGR